MKKIINSYMMTEEERSLHPYSTGLVLELEDGTILAQRSTDPITQYEVVKDIIYKVS